MKQILVLVCLGAIFFNSTLPVFDWNEKHISIEEPLGETDGKESNEKESEENKEEIFDKLNAFLLNQLHSLSLNGKGIHFSSLHQDHIPSVCTPPPDCSHSFRN